MNEPKKYYGKYRGTVVNNVDPMQIGRIQVMVPDVSNVIPSTWAMPCFPFTGKEMGAYMLPQIGSGVWVEFEQGDPDYPVWVGGYWGLTSELPALALAGNPVSPSVVFQTGLQNTIVISDLAGPPAASCSRAPPAPALSSMTPGSTSRTARAQPSC